MPQLLFGDQRWCFLGEEFPSAARHHRQWGYPETVILGRDQNHQAIFSPEEAALKVREILSRA